MPVRKLLPVLWLTLMGIGIAYADTSVIRKSASLNIRLVIVELCNIQMGSAALAQEATPHIDCTASTPYLLLPPQPPRASGVLPLTADPALSLAPAASHGLEAQVATSPAESGAPVATVIF